MMSKINIKVMSEAAIAYLKNNSEEVTNKILARADMKRAVGRILLALVLSAIIPFMNLPIA